jgi:SanA protein
MFLSRFSAAHLLILIGALLAVLLSLPRWLLSGHYSNSIFTPQSAPPQPTALVLGAGLTRDGRPTAVLADRVMTAVALYQQGKVDKILMSGSSKGARYNESAAMQSLAIQLGVPEEAIVVDDAGDRTYQSCLHAKQVFGVERALVVSQRYHLPRALAICDALGMAAVGVAADLRPYRAQLIWELREIPATLRALWDAYVCKPDLAHQPPDNGGNLAQEGPHGS